MEIVHHVSFMVCCPDRDDDRIPIPMIVIYVVFNRQIVEGSPPAA